MRCALESAEGLQVNLDALGAVWAGGFHGGEGVVELRNNQKQAGRCVGEITMVKTAAAGMLGVCN